MAAKILIVDDEPLVVEVITTVVRTAGLEPICAPTLERAREITRLERPDVVLCDVHLPDGPGTSLIAYLRQLDEQVEVVMMTGGTRFELVVEAIREGASDFLEKPFSIEQIGDVIDQSLARRAQRRTPAEPTTSGVALLIDSSAASLRSMGNMLAEIGVTSFQAQALDEAGAILGSRALDVVIADAAIEPGGGLALVRQIKSIHPLLPVVVTTGSSRPELAIEALRAGVFDVVLKPVDREEFQRAVLAARRYRSVLEERTRAQRELEGFRAGLKHLQQVLEQERRERANQIQKVHQVSLRTLESLPTGVLVLDRDMRIGEINPAVEKILGVSRETVLGAALAEVPVLASFQQAILQTLNTGQTYSNLETEISIGAARRSIGYGAAPMVGPEGGGAIVFFQDITARKRLEGHMRQSDRLAMLGVTLAGVTQELSGPLTIALGYTDLLAREVSDPGKVKVQTEKIQTALRRANDIATRLTRLTTASSGDARPLQLAAALQNAVGLIERKLQVGSHQIQLGLAPDLPETMGDPVEFEQLFVNILLNACDAMPGGGTVTVLTGLASGGVEVKIVDTGVGIPEANMARIFDPFFTTKEGGKASGLGLAICKNTVERYGGTIRLESEPGRGTTVLIRFPVPGQEQLFRPVLSMVPAEPRSKVS